MLYEVKNREALEEKLKQFRENTSARLGVTYCKDDLQKRLEARLEVLRQKDFESVFGTLKACEVQNVMLLLAEEAVEGLEQTVETLFGQAKNEAPSIPEASPLTAEKVEAFVEKMNEDMAQIHYGQPKKKKKAKANE